MSTRPVSEAPKHADEMEASQERPSRREVLGNGAAGLAGGLLALGLAREAQGAPTSPPREGASAGLDGRGTYARPLPAGQPLRDYLPVTVPNAAKLPWKVVDGVKVFHLVAEEVEHEFAPGLKALCWGYNGRVHGPLIEAMEGERVRIYVTNRLATSTSVHWHSMLVPSGMDGVGGLSHAPIPSGETYRYEFTLRQSGTAMYHSHHDEMTQIGMGMTGLFVIHPRRPRGPRVDRDFALLLHEWRIDAGARRPNPNEMTDFNILTINAKAFPGTEPLVVRTGQRVRIRIGNLSPQNHHPIHLHGFHFWVTETDGGPIPASARWPEGTVLVPVGQTRTIEFVADAPGDFAMHCHMTHHMMNQMGHEFLNVVGMEPGDLDARVRKLLPGYMTMGTTGMDMSGMDMPVPPNSIPMKGGQGRYGHISMGGMVTVIKVRDGLASYEDPGWYENPPGTMASRASPEELARDGIEVGAPPPKKTGAPPHQHG